MNRVVYKTGGLISLKKYHDSHLNARSYTYPMLATLRGAILSAIIQLEGVEKAKELFHKVKNAVIYIEYQPDFHIHSAKLQRLSNEYYTKKKEKETVEDKLTEEKEESEEKPKKITTMGIRQFVDTNQIVFYIDDSIPNIETYLKNIDTIGDSSSFVYLESIKPVSEMKNILVRWNEKEHGDAEVFELYDWSSDTEFDRVYFYNQKGKSIKTSKKRFLCCVQPRLGLDAG